MYQRRDLFPQELTGREEEKGEDKSVCVGGGKQAHPEPACGMGLDKSLIKYKQIKTISVWLGDRLLSFVLVGKRAKELHQSFHG